jgi:transcriptional regulator with XRE-family HTH domain
MTTSIAATSAVARHDIGHSPQFRDRLGLVISRIGSLNEAAQIAGYSTDQIRKWRNGLSRPPLFPIARMATAAGVSLDWLLAPEPPSAFRTIVRIKREVRS